MKTRTLIITSTALLVAVAFMLGLVASAYGLGPETLQPAGKMRVAAVSATNAINTTSTSWVDVPNLSTFITVPDGKVADVVIEFSAMVNSPDAQSVRARIDRSVASPGPVQVFYTPGNVGASSHGFNFYKFAIGPGTHTVKMQWSGLGGQQFMSYRSMILFVNLRNP